MRRHRRSLAGFAALALLAGPAALPALAQDATVEHRQSVLTELDADGTITSARYFTQLNVTGADALSVSDQPTAGLRNLESFGGVDRDGDALSYPAGFSRTVADFDGDQPVSIEVSYRLDGEPIEPRDLVGRSGEVEVTYRVSNDTAVPQELEFKDATGVWRTETVDVAVPMVGSLALDLDDRFTAISAPGAVTVGDGRGDTRLQWSLLLFAPLGSEVAEATWTAEVEDAVVPAVRIQVLPVDKTSFGSLASAEATYRSASDDTYALTQGAIKIDRSLGRLASGAASLLDGLGQLKDGAAELAGGLTAAVDGSAELSSGLGRLATGAGDLRDGVSQARNGNTDLAEGLGKLDAGAGALSAGLSSASDGGAELATGLTALDDGAAKVLAGLEELKAGLNADDGVPAAIAGVDQLGVGVDKAIAGIGSPTTPDTLLFGLAALSAGLPDAETGAGEIAGGLEALGAGITAKVLPGIEGIGDGAQKMIQGVDNVAGCSVATLLDADGSNDTPCGMKDVLQFIRDNSVDPAAAGLAVALLASIGVQADALDPDTETLLGGLGQINGGAAQLLTGFGSTTDCATAAAIAAAAASLDPPQSPPVLTALTLLQCGAEELQAGLGDAVAGVTLLNGGMSNPWAFDPTNPAANPTCEDRANPAERCGLLQGLQLVAGGLDLLGISLSGALADVNAGLGSTTEPAETLLYGMGQLSTGATSAKVGAGTLSAGLVQLDDGAGELAAGADAAAEGAGDLADGLGQIEAGAGELATGARSAAAGGSQLAAGLPDARSGAQQIADGLTMANIGGGQIADGAVELGEKGTSVLAAQVNDAAAGTNKLVAQLVAVDERGRTEALPYPAAEGATATAVFQYDLAGIETTGMGESGRTIVAIGLLGAAGGLGFLGRRRLTGF